MAKLHEPRLAAQKIFDDLSTDPLLASYELMQRIEKDLAKGTPTDAGYNTACGCLEAFYEANSWKPPERLNAGGYTIANCAHQIAEAAPDSPNSFPGPLVPEAMKYGVSHTVAVALDGSPSPPIQPRAIVPGNPLNEA